MYCEKCGVKLLDNAVFCSECGAEVAQSNSINDVNEAHMPAPKRFCEQCGTEIKNDDKFCNNCGTAISELLSNENVKTSANQARQDVIPQKNLIKVLFIIGLIIAVVGIILIPAVIGIVIAKKHSVKNELLFDQYIEAVKQGHPLDYPDKTYGEAFEEFFSNPFWRYFVGEKEGPDDNGDGVPDYTEENLDIVEFTGGCTYLGEDVEALIQFTLSKNGETFEATYLSFNDVPQNKFMIAALMEAVFADGDLGAGINNELDKPSDDTSIVPFTEAEIQKIAISLGVPQNMDYYYEQGKPYYNDVYERWLIYVNIWDDKGGYANANVEPGTLEPISSIMPYSLEQESEGFILPDSDRLELTEADLVGLSPQDLTYARNEIYARHGYIFQSQELNSYFATKDWYYPDSDIDQSSLTQLELKNADYIRQYQDATGKQYRPY